MSDGQLKYFAGKNDKIEQLLSDYRAADEATGAKIKSVIEQLGANHLYGRNGGIPYGILMTAKEGETRAPEKEHYRSHKDQPYIYSGEVRQWVYLPMKNTKKGKEIDAILDTVGSVATFSDFVIKQLNINAMEVVGFKAIRTSAGMVNDHLVIAIPIGDREENNRVPNAEWDLTEVTKSQFIAITEENQSLDDIKPSKRPVI